MRNAILAGIAGTIVALGREGGQLSPLAWLDGLSAGETIVAFGAVLLVVVALGQSWFLVELLRQHGRMLARLDLLEGRLQGADVSGAKVDAASVSATANGNGNGNGNGNVSGLTVGVQAPEFELMRIDGARLSLTALRARGYPVVLVFSDPACGPCNALLLSLEDWQRRHSGSLTLAILSRGTVDENDARASERGFHDLLLQEDGEVAEAYDVHGTPSAALVSVEARIASPLAAGADAIAALVDTAIARSVSVLQVPGDWERGLAARRPPAFGVGSQAPDLAWKDLNRRAISLRALRGAPVLLAFWNPNCGRRVKTRPPAPLGN